MPAQPQSPAAHKDAPRVIHQIDIALKATLVVLGDDRPRPTRHTDPTEAFNAPDRRHQVEQPLRWCSVFRVRANQQELKRRVEQCGMDEVGLRPGRLALLQGQLSERLSAA